MDIQMSDINKIVADTFRDLGVDTPTLDQRIEVLAGLAKNVAVMEDVDSLVRIRVSLEIAVEIIRLRTEKQLLEG